MPDPMTSARPLPNPPTSERPAPAVTSPPAGVNLPTGALLCLALASFGSGMAMRVNDAMLPQLAQTFTVSVAAAAQLVSLYAIAYGVAQLLFGPLGDRYGKYRVIGWAVVACSLSSLLCGLALDFDRLRLARMLAGATAAAVIPLAMAWIGDVVAYEQRQPVLARFLIGQICGLSMGVWLGGFAADHLGWRTPYFVLTALYAGVGVALFLSERRLPPEARAMRRGQDSALRRMAADFAHVLEGRWARVVLATVFLEGLFLFGPLAFVAAHLHRRLEVSLSTAGALAMLFGMGGLGFALGSRTLVARLGERGLARAGGVSVAVALVTLAFAPAWPWAMAGSLGAGLGFYMLHNTLQVNATQMAPERRGAAVSAFAACFFLGQSAGVSASGWWVEQAGSEQALVLGALGTLAVALNFGRLLVRRG